MVLVSGRLAGMTCGVCICVTVVGAGSAGASGVCAGTLLGGAWAGRAAASYYKREDDIRYCAAGSRQFRQAMESAPMRAHGAACATPGVVISTENGASAMAATATAITLPIPRRLISIGGRQRSNAISPAGLSHTLTWSDVL